MQEALVLNLTREVQRVITTPYTPSLHNLERIMDDIPYEALRQWADCKPCQVPLLAAVTLEQFPSTTKLLARLGYIREFRDALLDRAPILLDQVLRHAIENSDEENLNVCIAMLSCPIAEHVAVPARIPVFLTKLLSSVVENPCPANIKPLYEVMEGLLSNSELIKHLPNGLMETFQREGTKIMRSLNDPLGTLLSIATFARIRRLWQPTTPRDYEPQDYEPQWLANISQIFGPKKASKTLDLVIMSAVMACSNSSNQYTQAERTLLVRLAIEICHGIDEDRKKEWLTANSAKLVKLCDKLRHQEIDAELQVMGLTLLINFSRWLSLPREIYQMMDDRLFTERTCNMITLVPEIERETLFERLITRCDDKANLSHLTYAISALEENGDTDESSLARIRISLLWLSTLKRLGQHLPVSRSYMPQLCVEDVGILRAYAQGFSFRDTTSQCGVTAVCCSEAYAWKDRLFLEFLGLILSETTARDGAEKNIEASSRPQELLETVLSSLKESSLKRSRCMLSQLKEPERLGGFALGRSKSTVMANTEGSSHEWRSKVASLLLESAQASHETVIQQMQTICQDFETRCIKVEEPLAIAIHERDQLKEQLENSRRLNLESEDRAQQLMELVSTLRKQIEESVKQVNEYSFQVKHLTDQVDALQNELDDTRKESQANIELVRSKARDRELDLMATVAERDDLLEEQQAEINAISKERAHHQATSRECDALRQEIARLQKESAQERDILRCEATKLQQVMEIRESTNAEKDNQIMALSSTAKDLRGENQMLKDKLEQEKSNAMALISSLEEARQNYQTSIIQMETRLEEQISQAHKQAEQMTNRHNLEVASLRKNAANATAKSEKDLRAKDKRVQQLERKVESLRNERAAKAREFSEAQEHISRLMSVMGFTKDSKDENRRLDKVPRLNREVRRSSRLSELQTQSCPPSQGETQFSVAPPTPPPRVTESFRQDTATRRRSHRLAETISFANNSNISFLPDQKERQPLGHIDRNSPTKSSQPNSNSKESDCNNQEPPIGSLTNVNIADLGDIDLDFDGDDLLTSTLPR